MLHTADALVLVLDRQGRIVRFNAKCAAVSGRTEEEARGRPIWEFLPDARRGLRPSGFRSAWPDRDRRNHLLDAGARSKSAWAAAAGAERLIVWRPSLVFEPDGRVRYVIGVGLDVTDQRRLEEQVRQSQKLETLATLVGGIAHDFNNQLTAVIGNLDLVLEDLRPAGEGAAPDDDVRRNLREWVESAEQAAQRCAAMTARLLTFSRGRIGSRQAAAAEPAACRRWCGCCGRSWPPSVRVEVRAPDDVWPIEGDWAQLHQVIHALAVNAGDAMPDGGVLTLALANHVVGPEECGRRPGGAAGPVRRIAGAGRGPRHDGGGARPPVRAVLHDQAVGPRRRPGAVRGVRRSSRDIRDG